MPFIEIHGAQLAYDDRGSGDNVLLFIHGHPFDRRMWTAAAEAAVTGGWRTILPDLRGYGESAMTPGKVTLDNFADDLIALLDARGVNDVVVCGLSMGGQIAMALCDRYPDRVRAVLLVATFAQAETEGGRVARYDLADRLEAEGVAEYANECLPKMLSAPSVAAFPKVADNLLAMMREAQPFGAAAALRGRAERPDYFEALRRFERPALVVAGELDAFTSAEDAEFMAAALPNGRLLRLPRVGHMPNLEAPEIFHDALLNFLADVAELRGRAA